MAFPSTIDGTAQLGQPAGTSLLATSPDHATVHDNLSGAVTALENKVGLNSGSAAVNQLLFGQGAGSTSWGSQGTAFTFINSIVNNGTLGTNLYQSGTANGLVLGTPTIGTVTVPGTIAALSFSAAIAPGVGTIVDSAGGTLTVNAQQGQVFYSVQGTSAGNRTIGTPQNPSGYQQLTYAFKASGSANGTIIWSGIFRGTANAAALGTGTSWNYYGWRYNSIDSKWDFMGQSLTVI